MLHEAQLSLPGMLATAIECRKGGRRLHEHRAAKYCNGVVLTSAYAMGYAKDFLQAVAWRWKSELRHQGSLKADDRSAELGIHWLVTHAGAMPSTSVRIGAKAASVANVGVGSTTDPGSAGRTSHDATEAAAAGQPVVYVMMDGRKVRALLDTGQSDALELSAAVAKALRLVPVGSSSVHLDVPGVWNLGKKRSSAATHVVMVKRFQLGGLAARNLMASVVPDGYSEPAVSVGLPLLARFAEVTLTPSQVVFGTKAVPCASPIRLRFTTAANRVGGRLLMFHAHADGMPVEGAIDTGANAPLVALRQLTRDGVQLTEVASGRSRWNTARKFYRSYLRVEFGNNNQYHVAASRVPAFPNMSGSETDFLFGWPNVEKWNMRLSFSPPSLCLLPRALAGSPHQ